MASRITNRCHTPNTIVGSGCVEGRMTWKESACRSCHAQVLRPVMAIAEEGLPPGHPGHHIVYSHVRLSACQACGCGEIEELDHDCFDCEDLWTQTRWY